MYTSHGHHIVGTEKVPLPPDTRVVRCGGPLLCRVCGPQALKQLYSLEDVEKPKDDPTCGPTYLLN